MNKFKIVRVFLVISIILICLTFNSCKASKKTYSKFEMSINLTEDFVEVPYDGVTAYYISKEMIVMCHKEPFNHPSVGDYYDVVDFAKACLNLADNNYHIQTRMKYAYYIYEDQIDGQMQRIVATFHESNDGFWLIQFCTHRGMYVERKHYIFEYADSVKFN